MPASMPLGSVILAVISHTPLWVWSILALLVVLGSLQLRDHSLPRLRVLLQPVALGAYSLWGTAAAFGAHAVVLAAWGAGLVATLLLVRQLRWPEAVRFDAVTNRFHVPGNAVPLVLMLTIFAVRYVVAVTLAFHQDWASDALFAAAASGVYGALSGVFSARALNILAAAVPTHALGHTRGLTQANTAAARPAGMG